MIKTEERWKDVPGFLDLQASDQGNIRKAYPDGSYRVLAMRSKKVRNRLRNQYTIRYSIGHRKYKDLMVSRLVYITFKGSIPDNYSVIHKNGLHSDNAPYNLVAVDRRFLGEKFANASRRKPVVKCDEKGEELEYFPSATAAGAENYMCCQTVVNYCNSHKKAPDGYFYRWDNT